MENETAHEELWSAIIRRIEEELGETKMQSSFRHAVLREVTDDELTIAVINKFQQSLLKGHYTDIVHTAAHDLTGKDYTITFVVDESLAVEHLTNNKNQAEELLKRPLEPPAPADDSHNTLDPKYTFDSFIVGDSNSFARSAALAVAEQPGFVYNPLFISGGPGLGKTHLLQAIGNYDREVFPHKKIVYSTAEEFFTKWISSVNKHCAEKFKDGFRSADILLIDDIQFLEGKGSGIDQFFHIFNHLYAKKAQIVIASDRAAAEIDMDERMTSRFAQGLEVDVLPPSYELRYNIIKRLLDAQNIPYDPEIINFLSDKNIRNIRELEGAVTRIIAYASLSRLTKITVEVTKDVTRDLLQNTMYRVIKIATIQSEVCKYYGINRNDLIGNKRKREIVLPRHIAMYLSQELTDNSLPQIGREFGNKDHTTVMHGTSKIRKLMKEDNELYQQIEYLINQIKKQG